MLRCMVIAIRRMSTLDDEHFVSRESLRLSSLRYCRSDLFRSNIAEKG